MESGLDPDDDIILPSQLDRHGLDWSHDSLSAINNYLRAINALNRRRSAPWGIGAPKGRLSRSLASDPRLTSTILRVGAYVGETIRRRYPDIATWYFFSEWIELKPSAKDVLGSEAKVDTALILARPDLDGVWPGNKVLKFIVNGDEDDVQFYAAVMGEQHFSKA